MQSILSRNWTRIELDNKIIQAEGEILLRNKVDTTAFRFYWTIIRIGRDDISDVTSTMDI